VVAVVVAVGVAVGVAVADAVVGIAGAGVGVISFLSLPGSRRASLEVEAMARSQKRAFAKEKPHEAELVEAAREVPVAADMLQDAMEESGVTTHYDLMVSLLRSEQGKTIFVETPNWMYAGILAQVGRDFIILEKATQVADTGRHNEFMLTGVGTSMELEPTGGPARRLVIPLDWIGPWCLWPFPLPDGAI
jgi:hypothetical protein